MNRSAVGLEFVSPSSSGKRMVPDAEKNCHRTIMLLHCADLVCKYSVNSAVLGTTVSFKTFMLQKLFKLINTPRNYGVFDASDSDAEIGLHFFSQKRRTLTTKSSDFYVSCHLFCLSTALSKPLP